MNEPNPHERRELIAHVQEIQREVRTCTDCGLCCTDMVNTARILPIEALRVADHLKRLPPPRRDALIERLKAAVQKYQLVLKGPARRYTCGFLEQDQSCALPFDVKPVVCLSFNPQTEDHCDMDEELFHEFHEPVEEANEAAGWPDRRVAIPLAVLLALEGKVPQKQPLTRDPAKDAPATPRDARGPHQERGEPRRHPR